LVVPAEVDGGFAEDPSGGGVDDRHVELVDQERDVGSGVGSAHADVAESAADAEGDGARVVDAVPAGSGVGVVAGAAAGGGCDGAGVGGGGCFPVGQRAVWANNA